MQNLPLFAALALGLVCANVTVAYFWGFVYDSAIQATSNYPVIALLCKLGPFSELLTVGSLLPSAATYGGGASN